MNFLILPIVVGLVAVVLASLALPLGPLLKSMPPLKAYAIDIGGSLTGIADVRGPVRLRHRPGAVVHRSPSSWSVVLDVGRGISHWTFVNVGVLLPACWSS